MSCYAELMTLTRAHAAKLKIQLQEQRSSGHQGSFQEPLRGPGSSSIASGSQATNACSSVQTTPSSHRKDRMLPGDLPSFDPRNNSNSPELHEVWNKAPSDRILDVIYSGWNPDLPERHILEH